MAASRAPPNTANVSYAPSSNTTKDIGHNLNELCRSCGKTNAELYDLFQTASSPFSTSSTTCYPHLNNCSSSSSTSTLFATNKQTTALAAAGCAKSSVSQTFDSLAATAKASAKGQSNMDNILQEMQIWQLLIKCNDGLPQRICAKCTAQFYMIHKFRRKCLKVQTQLRALYEEQQKFYERQQQQRENSVTVKDATTIEATSTPASPVAVATAVPNRQPEAEAALLAEVVKPPPMHKVNDLVNDNYGEPQPAIVDNTNTKSSVSFEANTGNTNDFIAPSTTDTTALLDNAETMLQKTEANEPTPTTSVPPPPPLAPAPASAPAPAPAFIDKAFEARVQEHCTVTIGLKLKDEKIPLLKPAILDSKRSPPLTLQQPLEQICDNDATTGQANASKKPCLDQEELLETHIIFKSNNKQNCLKSHQQGDGDLFQQAAQDAPNTFSNLSPLSLLNKAAEAFKLRSHHQLNLQKHCGALNKANSESLFITKAALKAYTIPPSTSETENREYQKPITNSKAIELKNANHSNDNAHGNISSHRYDNRSALNDNICSSTSNSTPPFSTASHRFSTMSKSSAKQERTNIRRRKIIKYANQNTRPGHCYKSNVKAATVTATATATTAAATATTKATTSASAKKARTIISYGGGMAAKRIQRSQPHKYKLKRLPNAETSSSSSRARGGKRRQPQKARTFHRWSLQRRRRIFQMDDEMLYTVSTTFSTSPSPSPSSSSSSSAISSTSLHLRTTTPAVTDLVRNSPEVTSYRNNANENIKKTACSTADRLSSDKSCIMWKTKAAMKANGNDMSVEAVVDDDGEASTNMPQILLPYTETETEKATETETAATTTTATPTPTVTASFLCSSFAKEAHKSSKTLHENQSIHSSVQSNNNNLMENYTARNKVMSTSGNQVKDTEGETQYLQKSIFSSHNLWPEEAGQEQIYAKSQTNNQPATIEVEGKHTRSSNGCAEQENPQNVQGKHSTTGTPSAKTGCMKLIIQRKRGARFKCRRKDDDDSAAALHDTHEPTKTKRKRKSSHRGKQRNKAEKLLFPPPIGGYSKPDEEATPNGSHCATVDKRLSANKVNDGQKKVPPFNSEEDENKENPIPIINNNYELDSDSNVSVYRDPLLIRNEMLEEDIHLADFSKTPLSLQTECTKEMYKLYKEKANLESPKKLIVRVPLTSLTQDFKKLHLTMEDPENEGENEEKPDHTNMQDSNEETLCIEVLNEPGVANEPLEQANIRSSQSNLLGLFQSTASSSGTIDSSEQSTQLRYTEPPLCSASSKINDFINDFQNNCIDSSEIEETCDMIPTLAPRITQELSDEIRDVEDTLNGILSEMHDKDMYTPRSGETDEFFAHSVYSPLTDSPTTPSQSFYAESPCTISSNPMSVSPFISHNMDYNAMTPRSNHSSMGLCSSYMGGGANMGSQAGVYSEHYSNYNECFEESTQSELIGFQNDIPCFENIEMTNSSNSTELQLEPNEEIEGANAADNNEPVNNSAPSCVTEKPPSEVTDYVDLNTYEDKKDHFVAAPSAQPAEVPVSTPPQIPYSTANYQHLRSTPTLQIRNPLMSNTAVSQPHYIVTNTSQGSIIIANPQHNSGGDQTETSFKPHGNNLQFVTLGHTMETSQTPTPTPPNQLINHTTAELNWPTSVNPAAAFNQQPVLPTTAGTTTYFINANGELYQANIPTANLQNPSVNTIFVPPSTGQTFSKASIDNNDNYMQAMQRQPRAQQQSTGQSSQYIMLVNNLGGSPQYYATAHSGLNQTVSVPQNITAPTVLFQSAPAQSVQNNASCRKKSTNQSSADVAIAPALEAQTETPSGQTAHQKMHPQLQKQTKQRQLQILQPKSPNVAQKITLICRFCHKRPKFNNNVDYSNHIINTHPAEKPYNCPHCTMHFSRRSERQMHVAQVHGSRYQCAQCCLSFCAQRTLDFHLQKYHANLGRSHQHLQQNSSSTTAPATYQLLQHNNQQRLVRIEDVRVQVTGENMNKRYIDLPLDDTGGSVAAVGLKASQSINEVEILPQSTGISQKPQQQQQARKLCSPDCNGDTDDCCGLNQNHDKNSSASNATQAANNAQQYARNESVNNHPQQHSKHITIPSPEQTEPDSTTTLRHFRKRQLCEVSPHFASASPSSSSSSSPSIHNNAAGNNVVSDKMMLSHNSPENISAADGGFEQIVVERTLRASHNCLLCEESFTNEIALRKHHHLAHGAATQSTTCSSGTPPTPPLVCAVCKRAFRMRTALQRHMETHDAEGRPYECNICQVRFPRPSQLTLHKLTVHKFEKPNPCEECGKQFGTESAMKAHTAEHAKAGSATTTSESSKSASFMSTSPSTSSSSSAQSQSSSRLYLDTIAANSTTFTTEDNKALLQSTPSVVAISSKNNSTLNAATQNAVESGLVTST